MDEKNLILNGYKIENAKIENIDLSMEDHGVLTFSMELNGGNWGCTYGGYCLGKGYLGAKDFSGSPKGIEYLMRIMDTVGVLKISELKGEYVRVATKGWGSPVKIIGNILKDKWFDTESFFSK